MPDTLISALVQAPFVLVMVYLVNRFLTHLDAHDQDWRDFTDHVYLTHGERLDRLTEAIDRLSQLVVTHDAAMRCPSERDSAPRSAVGESESWPGSSRRR